MSKVELSNVRKEFGDVVAVEEVPISIQDDELLVLLGPSGCGKSTTLRLIAGLEHPTEGQITIGNRDVTDVAPQSRDIAMVFQDLALYPHKSVRENMVFGLAMRGHSDEEANEQLERTAELLQISDLLERSPDQLSGGQQQRVAIGRAIVRDPEVFLLDEPLSDLDAKLRATLRTEILSLHQELNATMIYVTHDQEEAMTLGDRIAVMDAGTIHQIDHPATIYNRPTDLFVARFVGNPDINLFEGMGKSEENTTTVESEIFEYTLEGSYGKWKSDKEPVQIGIRSETFHHPGFLPHNADQTLTISAEVQLIENLGDHYNVHLEKAGHEFIASVDHFDAEVGEVIDIVADLSEIHYFDPNSGNRIEELDTLEESTPVANKT